MTTYCIYTDKVFPKKEMTREHIIPISLGGVNGFEVLVEKEINKFFGSNVDGKIANDVLIQLDRKNADARGHSNKPVLPIWTNVKIIETGEPLQIKFEKPGLTKFISPISKREIEKAELNGKNISISLKLDAIVSFQFTAKVALAAGYFIYGDLFKNFADTESLRKFSIAKNINKDNVSEHSKLKFTDRFHCHQKDTADVSLFTEIAKLRESSAVIVMLCESNLIISVSLFGKYLGTVNVAANTDDFPNNEEFRLGQVVFLNSTDDIERISFYDTTLELAAKLGSNSAGKYS